MLFNSLGLGEDEIPMALKPDCTDMVYYLRAYFAFKVGLPFGYSRCSRGKPPTCSQWFSIVDAAATKQGGLAASFARYLPVVGDAVQSGAVRTLASDDKTDFYMDLSEGLGNDWEGILEQGCHSVNIKKQYAGGSNYGMVDGSARFMRYGGSTYPLNLWAVSDFDRDKNKVLPP